MIGGRGQLTLVNGQATVNLPRIPAGAVVVLAPQNLLGTIGTLKYAITPKSGFTVTSVSLLDQSVVGWVVLI